MKLLKNQTNNGKTNSFLNLQEINITIHNRLIQWVYSKAEITSNVDWNSILKGANLIQVDWHYQSGGPIGAHIYMYRDTFCWSICDTQYVVLG